MLGGEAAQGSDGVVVALRFADGSVASIAYGSAPPVAGKERIEVLAGSHQVIIDDFRSVLVERPDPWKGGRTRATAPTPPRSGRRCAVAGEADVPDRGHATATMRATIRAAEGACVGNRALGPYG